MNKKGGAKNMKGKNMLVIMIVITVVVGVGAFFGGMYYQKSQNAVNPVMALGAGQGQRFMQGGATTGQGNRMMVNRQGPVRGEIISADDKSITVKMQDGSTKIVVLSDKTTINKATTGSQSDLKTGEQVTAFGSTNADGSVTAQMVTLGTGAFSGGVMQGKPAQEQK